MSRRRLIYPDSAFKAESTRVRGLATWSPQYKTQKILNQVRNILTEYADYLPLTLRQIFYRLVGAYGFPKTEDAYGKLGKVLEPGTAVQGGFRGERSATTVSLYWVQITGLMPRT